MKTDRELSARLIEAALARGASLAEVYQCASSSKSADVLGGAVEAAKNSSTFGYGLRIVKHGRPGFSYSNNPDDAISLVDTALATSDHSEADEAIELPDNQAAPEVSTFDPRVCEMTEQGVAGLAGKVEQGALEFDSRVSKIRKASASMRTSHVLIMNSKGLVQSFMATSCAANIMAVAEEGGDAQLGWGFSSGRFLIEVDFRQVGSDAARRATQMLGARRTRSARCLVLLDPSVSAGFLSVFASMLSAENVQKGRSLLKGKIGERVIHKSLSVVDDGLNPIGPGRRPVDDEGTAVRKNILIKEGVLEGFLYNTHSANRDGVSSTGNALRGGPSGIPSVGAICMFFQPSSDNLPRNKLFSGLNKGLYVTDAMGVHTINPVSGDYSIGVSGLWYEDGAPQHPVKEAVIAGNVLDLFGSVVSTGDDLTFFGSMGSPSLLLGPVDLSA
ncbi:MAG TPA: TldD/PmbA family protein [Nitrospirae bacterium]|nr:TldD/PmbA family protein [Nitrospirota bacterium]